MGTYPRGCVTTGWSTHWSFLHCLYGAPRPVSAHEEVEVGGAGGNGSLEPHQSGPQHHSPQVQSSIRASAVQQRDEADEARDGWDGAAFAAYLGVSPTEP